MKFLCENIFSTAGFESTGHISICDRAEEVLLCR
jgi:hypothetical protein